ncbi:MAG: cytochrome c oxidase subunit 3 family protein [Desulfofustis sp.]|nr:cytochrome c oxidase subunit 3 family protein [Desulfofustis sp.]MBT8345663.1 cytochrome c oxidase subunit 3 family protein [Desulfofustis sp.]MBT8355703.1 cytochrome c oxidase subunit 3 family protein [Desulfofustis sp.]NNF46657.1 cytochrome c oxidase subunit 3 family protein [Desulfofustis sp.]NNK13544.1 cytochrome c oxidase subunit 3 family protein [Desulfofustis sp.]
METAIDKTGVKIGMWIFLYSEIILFGGLFVLYAVYFHTFPEDFAEGGKELNRIFGTANTLVLLISSFTVAASITAVQRRKKGQAIGFLIFSLLCGLAFLVNKYFEWGAKFHHDLYPNSDLLLDSEPGFNIFFGLYYTITGLHGLHVIIGMVLLSISLGLVIRDKVTDQRYAMLENSGLYWHLVDLIWIYVFPLFYLVL